MSGENNPAQSDIDPELMDSDYLPALEYMVEEYQPMLPGMETDARGYAIRSDAIPMPTESLKDEIGTYHLPEFE
jgi:hypothetical protein